MEGNPYQSPEAESEPVRRDLQSKGSWLKAFLLAAVSWVALWGLAILAYQPNARGPEGGPVFQALLWLAAPLDLVVGVRELPHASILLLGSGYLIHAGFWAVVLSIWRRRRATNNLEVRGE